jgi:membrane-bound serine protease (ClpP class)
VQKALNTADERDAALVILTLDTPGGLAESMRAVIRDVLDSPVPVAAYVYPSGARAASAGAYIFYACHVAAMAPGTNLGAATPVQIGGGLPGREEDPEEEVEEGPKDRDAMEAKIIEDSVAYILSLAHLRGRNAEWAEKSVREGASLPVEDAVEMNVADLAALDLVDMLTKADGRTVTVKGREVTLRTRGLSIESIEPGWRIRLLEIITNPNIAMILMLIGIYGIIYEFANPGFILVKEGFSHLEIRGSRKDQRDIQ